MNTISREALKQKLDAKENVKLVMTMGEWAFHASHIPGSIQVSGTEDAQSMLNPKDKIVVYCSDPSCHASHYAYHLLVSKGYQDVWLYPGGLADWQAAGYPLEGRMVTEIADD